MKQDQKWNERGANDANEHEDEINDEWFGEENNHR